MDPDPFSPESLRLTGDEKFAKANPRGRPPRKSLPRPKPGEPYFGPVPMSWLTPAAQLPGRAWHLACVLWFEAVCSPTKSPTVRLTARALSRFGVTRKAFYRALGSLTKAGLVRYEIRTGRPTEVTILPAPKAKK